ncbi:MAG: type II toxin-antitoxin system prevent-host-death family antitoxin [Micrococcales bacterium]|nr:type II toxin-antitoxin system prevent-host-death family antitoxin [Micrococcales bacterium]
MTKRELNQQTAQVLEHVSASGQSVTITERGVPKWQVVPFSPESIDPLDLAASQGRATRPETGPVAWDLVKEQSPRRYTTQQIDELVQWVKGDR